MTNKSVMTFFLSIKYLSVCLSVQCMGEGVLYNFVFPELSFKTVSDDVTAFHRIA